MLAIGLAPKASDEDINEYYSAPASVIMQFYLLYKRNLLSARRNYVSILTYNTADTVYISS